MATLTTTGPGTRHEKESLNDYISRIDPAECPFYSNAPSKTVGAVKHEWTVQELEAVDGANFVAEGFDSDDANGYVPVRIDNAVSLSQKNGKVSGTYDRINLAGGQDETNRQKLLKGLSLKRDMEAILTANNAKVQAGTRELGGIQTYITNWDLGALGTVPAGDGSDLLVPGTDRALDTIAYIDNAMQLAYVDGGQPRQMYMSPGLCQAFSKIPDAIAGGAASNNQVQQTNSEKMQFVGAASRYLSDFGALEVIPSRHMAADVILMMDPDHYSKGTTPGGSMADYDLAKVGDSSRFQVIWEGTLEVDAPKAHAGVAAVDPTL